MNKSLLVVSLALLAAFTSAAPSEEIVTKVKELRGLVRTTLDEIEAAAIADNEEVGQSIKLKLEEEVKKAHVIIQEARAIETPTHEQSKTLLLKFLALLGDAKLQVKEDIKQLKPETQKLIADKFAMSLTKAKEIVGEISTELA